VGGTVNRDAGIATRPSTNAPSGTSGAVQRTVSPSILTAPVRSPWPQAFTSPAPGGTVSVAVTRSIPGCCSPTHFQYSSATSGPTDAACSTR